jgi:hypothetical protein
MAILAPWRFNVEDRQILPVRPAFADFFWHASWRTDPMGTIDAVGYVAQSHSSEKAKQP